MADFPPPPSPGGRPPPPSPGSRWGGAGQRVMTQQRSARNMGFGGGGGGGGMPPPPSPGGGRGGGGGRGYETQMTSDEEKQNQQLQNERRYLAQTRSGIRRFSAVSSPHLHGSGGGGSDEEQEYDDYGNPIDSEQEGIHKEPITLQQSLHDMVRFPFVFIFIIFFYSIISQ